MAEPDSTNRRISHLEAQVTGIATRLDAVDRGIDSLSAAIDRLSGLVSNKGTDWKALASWASVIIVIVVTVGGLSIQPIKARLVEMVNWQDEVRRDRWTASDQRAFEVKFRSEVHRELSVMKQLDEAANANLTLLLESATCIKQKK